MALAFAPPCSKYPGATVVHGACPQGADAIADVVAAAERMPVERHPANWGVYGKAAGMIRNRAMVMQGADVCLAFIRDYSNGATNCARRAHEAGIPVRTFRESSNVTNPLMPPAGATLAAPAGLVGKMPIKNKRYFDGVRYYQRVSTLLKNIETDSYQLEQWKKRQVARGLAKRPDLVLAVAAADQLGDVVRNKLTDEARRTIDDLCEQAMAEAKSSAGATAGTAMHTATERLDVGETLESIGLPYPYSVDLAAYQTLVKAMGLTFRPEYIERSLRNDTTENVGTIDRAGTSSLLEQRGVLAPGELLIVDVKTEGNPLLNLMHIAAQLAEYAHSDAVWVPSSVPVTEGQATGWWEPMPPVSKAVGLMIHIRDGRATPYLLDLTAGWRQCLRAAEQREQMKASKIKLGDPGCWAQIVPVDLPPATEVVTQAHERERAALHATAMGDGYAVGDTVTVGGIDFTKHAETPGLPPGLPPGAPDLHSMLLEQIDQADSAQRLGELWQLGYDNGIAWPEAAGDARGRIVNCPQRAMHDPTMCAKCACGWERGLRS